MCILNSLNLEAYYATVTFIIVLPCILGTIFNFGRIFLMRFRYLTHRHETKHSEADVELLMDPNHKMSAYLAIIFFISWIPYIVYLFTGAAYEPHLFEYWSGKAGAIWRLLILTIFPRYRTYLSSFIGSVKTQHSTPLHLDRPLQPTLPPDDAILHI